MSSEAKKALKLALNDADNIKDLVLIYRTKDDEIATSAMAENDEQGAVLFLILTLTQFARDMLFGVATAPHKTN